jgi:hypothetical protein
MERTIGALRGLSRSKWAKAGLALVILNEIRGVFVVASIGLAYFR